MSPPCASASAFEDGNTWAREGHKAPFLENYFSLDNEDMDLLRQEFTQIKRASCEHPNFNQPLQDIAAKCLGFKDCWIATSNRFQRLQHFCGGLAAALLNTATAGSYLSIVDWENINHFYSLTDFSLEIIFHFNKFYAVKALQYHD